MEEGRDKDNEREATSDGLVASVHIWSRGMGWTDWKMLERVQGRRVKMALRVNITTPNNKWEMKAEKNKFKDNNFARAGKYLMVENDMEEGR